MSPRSKPSSGPVVALALLASACTGAGSAAFPTAAELPTAPRRPDGVALDPASARPPPRDRASSRAGLVTLRAPLGTDLALATVASFFQAVVREDEDRIESLFARSAVVITPATATSGSAPPGAALFWAHRFKRLDYTRLASELVYRESEVEILHDPGDTDAPSDDADADLVVRVPIATPRVGLDRLFGDEMVLFLRRDGDAYRIQRAQEDFQLP